MRKTLHLLFLIALLAVAGGGSMKAEEVTIDLTAQGFKNQDKVTTVTSTPITLTFDKGKGNTDPAYYTKSPSGVRLYGSNTLKVDAGSGNTITKVVFTFTVKSKTTAASLSADEGTFDSNSKTWTGSAQSFTITNTASSGNAGFTKIVVTYQSALQPGQTATTLTFPEGSDKTFYQGDNVDAFTTTATLRPSIEGANISYESSDESIASVDGNGKVTVHTENAGSATITASYAGSDEYAASKASYTITVDAVYQSIAALKADAKSGEEALLKLQDAKVTYIDGNNKYLQDASGAICVFGKDVFTDYAIGDILNGMAKVTYKPYNGLPEITSFTAAGDITKTEGETPSPEEMTIADALKDENLCKYVIIRNVSITPSSNAGNATARDSDGNSIGVYKKGQSYTEGKYDLTGITSAYNNKQIAFISYNSIQALTIDENTDNTIEDYSDRVNVTLKRTFNANAWNSLVLPFDMTAEQVAKVFGADVKIAKYNDATAQDDGTYILNFETAQDIQSNTAVLIYGATGDGTYEIDGVSVVSGETPLAPGTDAFKFQGSYTTTTAEAGDWFISSDNNLYKAKGTETIKPTHAVFHPTTAAASAKGLSISFDGNTPTAISKITADGLSIDNTTPVYNLAGQRVGKGYKGIVVRNGRKYINK